MSETIAELLHSLMCEKDHTSEDGCPWYEESQSLWEWQEPVHLEYLKLAEDEMKKSNMTTNAVIDTLNIITKLDFNKSMTRKLVARFMELQTT